MAESVLDVFATLIGHCFVVVFAPGVEDKHCFSPVYAGAHVRDLHVVTDQGKSVYEGETVYSATPAGIVFTYVNSSGGSGTGAATVAGNAMTFAMTMRGDATGELKPYRGTLRIVSGGYEQQTEGEELRRFLLVR